MLTLILAAMLSTPLTIDVDGHAVALKIPGRVRTEQVSGRAVPAYSSEQAEAIAEALSREGLDYALPDVLAGQVIGPEPRTCVHIDGRSVIVAGAILHGRSGRIMWSPAQLRAFADSAGPRVLPSLMGLYLGQTAGLESDTPLAPGCGECQQGKSCIVDTKETCCAAEKITECMSCKICLKVKRLSAELP